MGRGKLAAQVAHAAVLAALHSIKHDRRVFDAWIDQGQMKVVVKAESLEALLDVKARCEAEGLHTELVEDRGLTQIPPGTLTCLAIGPSDSDSVDKVTGNMKLL